MSGPVSVALADTLTQLIDFASKLEYLLRKSADQTEVSTTPAQSESGTVADVVDRDQQRLKQVRDIKQRIEETLIDERGRPAVDTILAESLQTIREVADGLRQDGLDAGSVPVSEVVVLVGPQDGLSVKVSAESLVVEVHRGSVEAASS